MFVAKAINVRLDADSERALRVIKSSTGVTSSEAVRAALVEAAGRHVSDDAIREAARQIASDPNERRLAEEWIAFQDDRWEDLPE